MLRRPQATDIDSQLALVVLEQIKSSGLEGVRVDRIADRLEVAVGTLYKRWGNRGFLLEQTWRTCVASADYEVNRVLQLIASSGQHKLPEVCERIAYGLPQELDAFFELHAARSRWLRGNEEPEALIVPSLVTYAELNLRQGHFRAGPASVIASTIWWTVSGALRTPARHDRWQWNWCIEGLRRAVLSADRLAAEDPIESLVIEVEEPKGLARPY